MLEEAGTVPKESGFNQSETASGGLPGSPAMARDGEVKQRQHFYHYGDAICHPKSGYVTTKPYGTSTCRNNNNAIFSDSYFQVSCRLLMPATLIWPRQSLDSSCQTGQMAALLN